VIENVCQKELLTGPGRFFLGEGRWLGRSDGVGGLLKLVRGTMFLAAAGKSRCERVRWDPPSGRASAYKAATAAGLTKPLKNAAAQGGGNNSAEINALSTTRRKFWNDSVGVGQRPLSRRGFTTGSKSSRSTPRSQVSSTWSTGRRAGCGIVVVLR